MGIDSIFNFFDRMLNKKKQTKDVLPPFVDKREIEVEKGSLDGEVYDIVYSDFETVAQKLREAGEREEIIEDYKESLRLPPEEKTLRCSCCGNDTFEGRITNRVYLGQCGDSIDIIEDPQEDGELDDIMFCSKCYVELSRTCFPEVE